MILPKEEDIALERKIGAGHFDTFRQWLVKEEREHAIIEKYLREVWAFAAWLGGDQVTKEQVAMWKDQLGCQPATVNGKLSALNKFFSFLGWQGCRVNYLKIQRRVFRCSPGSSTGPAGMWETGGHSGALQHRNHQDIPHFNRGRTRQAAGLAVAGIVSTIKN